MKAIQKQYERKIKVNQNRDTFTTYQRLSQHDHSPIYQQDKQNPTQKQKVDNEHHRIESLKCTLKSMSQQASIDFSKVSSKIGEQSINERELEEQDHRKYNIKLDQLSKNLQQIASKGYFSPANSASQRPKSSTYNYNHSNAQNEQFLFEKSQKLSVHQPIRTEQYQRYNNNVLQFPASKSQTFIKEGSNSHTNSKNNSRNKPINPYENNYKETNRQNQQILWSGKSQFKNSSKKSFSKRDIIAEPLMYNSKNLTKIFQKYEDATIEFPKQRERADTQFKQNQVLFNKCIHRSKVTSILISDQIYTSSLDYTIRRFTEHDGEFNSQVVDKYRGGVEFVGLINNKIFGVGRDCYLRSIDGNFHQKFDNCPLKFYETERSTQVSIGFITNVINLYDLQKRTLISEVIAEKGYQLMSKWDKEMYIGDRQGLSLLDWRKKDRFVRLFRTPDKNVKNWMSFPFGKQFSYHLNGQVCILGDKHAKVYTHKLPTNECFKSYDWNRIGLNLMTVNESTKATKLIRFKNDYERQQIDIETSCENLSLVAVRQKQIIYGGSGGELIIKRIKR